MDQQPPFANTTQRHTKQCEEKYRMDRNGKDNKQKFRPQVSGQIGEHLVVAELGRRGILATPFAGNVPSIDILAYQGGNSAALQVKAIKGGSVSVDAKRYLHIKFDERRQIISGIRQDIDPGLIFVLIKIGPQYGSDEFYIFTQAELQKVIYENYQAWLSRHDGVRPKNWKTTHCAYNEKDFPNARDNWGIVLERLGAANQGPNL